MSETEQYYFSIETPTQEMHSFKGDNPRSACTDLSVWKFDEGFVKVANIEFKAGTPEKASIEKDLKKLVLEELPGNWFHTLKNANSQTLNVLSKKFTDSMKPLWKALHEPIVFSFCILDLGLCISKVFEPTDNPDEYIWNNFFTFDYLVSKGKLEIRRENGWSVSDLKLQNSIDNGKSIPLFGES